MKKPVLVVMAAGMGSRYGGLKQIDAVGKCGECILDYSLYDAWRTGFETAVIVINQKIHEDFMATVGARLSKSPLEIRYAYQELSKVPQGVSVSPDRVRPLGTGHALLCAREAVDGAPFAVINADDYYGKTAFQAVYDTLSTSQDHEFYNYCMVGYYLRNTLSENGSVARGACQIDEKGYLLSIKERLNIRQVGDSAVFEMDGETGALQLNDIVSMNLFGFTPSFFEELEQNFSVFCQTKLVQNPLNAEFYLPVVAGNLVDAGKAKIKVLSTDEKWFGVTYAADKPLVVRSIAQMTAQGHYPEGLWK